MMNACPETFNTLEIISKGHKDKYLGLALYNDTYEAILDLIPKKNTMISEIGCGLRNITKYLLSNNQKLKIEGIDTSEQMVSPARKNHRPAVIDFLKIDTIDGKLDAMMGSFVFHICPNQIVII
jgi:trans-aconitate methyltransferase